LTAAVAFDFEDDHGQLAAKPDRAPKAPPTPVTKARPRPLSKPRCIPSGPLTKTELREKALLDQANEPARLKRRKLPVLQMPTTRGGCANVPRPCPFVRCSANNYLVVSGSRRDGTQVVKVTFPDLEPWEMDPAWSCALDVAERGGSTVLQVSRALNFTEERERQIEVSAKRKIAVVAPGLAEFLKTDATWRPPSR
jgi:hypothetical protein